MSRFLALILAAVIAAPAHAWSMTGVLVHSEMTTTVTGRMAWRCVYDVAGSRVEVLRTEFCPFTMQFR